MYKLSKIIVLLLTILSIFSLAYASQKVYTIEQVIIKNGYAYNIQDNELISGIVRMYYDTGELLKEVSLRNGLRHGPTRSFGQQGNLYEEMIYDNEDLISGSRYDENGKKWPIDHIDIQHINSNNPNSSAYKEIEIVEKIEKAMSGITMSNYDQNLTKEQRFLKSIELIDLAFKKAGFDYFDTIKKVADDLRNHRDQIPQTEKSRHKLIIVLLAFEKSECDYQKVDCLKLYPPDIQKSVKWLWSNTEMSM